MLRYLLRVVWKEFNFIKTFDIKNDAILYFIYVYIYLYKSSQLFEKTKIVTLLLQDWIFFSSLSNIINVKIQFSTFFTSKNYVSWTFKTNKPWFVACRQIWFQTRMESKGHGCPNQQLCQKTRALTSIFVKSRIITLAHNWYHNWSLLKTPMKRTLN
jgi:hypothetical protein